MSRLYSTETLSQSLHQRGLPFAEFFARALVALLTARRISLHHVAHLMPGVQNLEANRQQLRRSTIATFNNCDVQQLRRCLDHETLTPKAWALAIAALLPRSKWILAVDLWIARSGSEAKQPSISSYWLLLSITALCRCFGQ